LGEVGLPDSEFPTASDTVSESGISRNSDHDVTEVATCPCSEHKGRLVLDCEFPVSATKLFELVFTENAWQKKFSGSCKRSDVQTAEWSPTENNCSIRTYTYKMELSQSFGPKSTTVTEEQSHTEFQCRGNIGHVVKKDATNAGIPYADSFGVLCTYCILPAGREKCALRVHVDVNFKKSIMGMIKGYIERSTVNGTEAYYKSLHSALLLEIQRSNRHRESQQDGYQSDEEDEVDVEMKQDKPRSIAHSSNHKVAPIRRTMDRTTSFGEGLVRSLSSAPVSGENSARLLEQQNRRMEGINRLLQLIVALLLVLVVISLYSSFFQSSEKSRIYW
jgi:hypothetical protein